MIVGAKAMSRAKIREYVRARIGKGMRAAAPFMRDMLRRTVGVQAPRRRSQRAVCGWVAITAAIPGAPPRRVSGCGQEGIYYVYTKYGVSFRSRRRYMQHLERRGHPWIVPTLEKYKREFLRIAGKAMTQRGYGYYA